MLKQVKVGAFGTQAQWNLVRSTGVGLSALVRHLPKTIPIVYRFSPLDCSAFVAPETAIAHVETGQSWCIWHTSAMESSEDCNATKALVLERWGDA